LGVLQVLEAGDVDGPSGLLTQRDHNVHAFLAALSQVKQVPSDCMFSIADLEAEHEERPQVANCLIFIKGIAQAQQYHASTMLTPCPQQHSQHSQQQHHSHYTDNVRGSLEDMMVTPPPQRSSCGGRLQHAQQQQQYGLVTPPSANVPYGHNSPSTRLSFAGTTPGSAGSFAAMVARGTPSSNQHAGLPPPMSSPLMDGHGNLRHSHGSLVPYHSSSGSLTPASMHGGSITAATHKSVQAAAGVTRLMQQCTHMLKERMFPNEQGIQRHSPAGGTPDMTMKAVAPVLEGVLGQLTEEYERRLLTKDHELSKAQNAQRRAEDEAQRVKASDGLAQQSYVLLSTCQTLRAGASLQHSACVPPVALIHAATVISTAAEHSVLNTH
jgi:hypothetical protein